MLTHMYIASDQKRDAGEVKKELDKKEVHMSAVSANTILIKIIHTVM